VLLYLLYSGNANRNGSVSSYALAARVILDILQIVLEVARAMNCQKRTNNPNSKWKCIV